MRYVIFLQTEWQVSSSTPIKVVRAGQVNCNREYDYTVLLNHSSLGATTCASGATCVFSNPYYSQCLPVSRIIIEYKEINLRHAHIVHLYSHSTISFPFSVEPTAIEPRGRHSRFYWYSRPTHWPRSELGC